MSRIEGYIVVPAYNEEKALASFTAGLADFLLDLGREQHIDFTILIVNDGSRDNTASVLSKLIATLSGSAVRLRGVSLLRNFGHQAAIIAGMLDAASNGADFVITMDADGEHPLSTIGALIAHWRDGDGVVHTTRRPHAKLPRLKRITSTSYYWLLRTISGLPIRQGMADFKLWDGDLLREIHASLPNCGSTRAFAVWLSPDSSVVPYEQEVAADRVSRFSIRKMSSLAVGGVVRYSDFPLRFSIVVGLLALAFAGGLTLFVMWAIWTNRTVPGWASIIVTIAVFGGLQSFAIGILGEYLLRNFFRQALPTFVRASRRRQIANEEDLKSPGSTQHPI